MGSCKNINPKLNSDAAASASAAASPTDLFHRDERQISFTLFKRIKRIKVTKYCGVVLWNGVLCYGFGDVAFRLLFGSSPTLSSSPTTFATPSASMVSPFYYRSLHSPGSTQLVAFTSLYLSASAFIVMLCLPMFCKVRFGFFGFGGRKRRGHHGGGGEAGGENYFNASPPEEGRFTRDSFFDDSEDDEWFCSLPASRSAIVGSRLPVALIGILAQYCIAYPLRQAAIVEATSLVVDHHHRHGYYDDASHHDKVSKTNCGGQQTMIDTPFPALHVILYNLFGLSLTVTGGFLPPSLLSFCSAAYCYAYCAVMLFATGALTPIWVNILDKFL